MIDPKALGPSSCAKVKTRDKREVGRKGKCRLGKGQANGSLERRRTEMGLQGRGQRTWEFVFR